MILATRYGGDRELRAAAWPDRTMPSRVTGRASWSGENVTRETASGLAAVGRAIRLVAGVVASLPLLVYEGQGGDKRERAGTRQARLLANPVAGMSLFDWKWDIASSLEVAENAFLLKVRDGNGRVVELLPIPIDYVYGTIDQDGNKVFVVNTPQGQTRFTSLDVLHIRGQTIGGGPFGVSRLQQHADPVGSMIAAGHFEGAYYRNYARPDVAIVFPQGVTQQQATQWREAWDANYGGPGNAGKALPLGGGAEIVPIPVSMRDSQYNEGRHFFIQEASRIMDVDSGLLQAQENADVRRTAMETFLWLQLPPRLRRIEEALRADLDLFQIGSRLYPEFRVDNLMFSDPLTRAQVQHFRVQDGTELVDEARADNGRPPLPDGIGQIPQITPVGGAPNEVEDELVPEPTGERQAQHIVIENNLDKVAAEISVGLQRSQAQFADKLAETSERVTRETRRALERVAAPQPVVVNVEPTPVQVNVEPARVTVEPVPVQLELALDPIVIPAPEVNVTVEEPPERERKRVSFERGPDGRIKSATVEEQ